MFKFLKKILFGELQAGELFENENAFEKQLIIIKKIWNNQDDVSFGIERIVKLILSVSQLFVPVMFIKIVFDKAGYLERKLAVEAYMLFKILFPLLCLFYSWYNLFVLIINILFLLETLLYLGNLVFLNHLTQPHSYRRAMLFVFLNYIEITLGFAAIYDYLNSIQQFAYNVSFKNKVEIIYFSFVTASTIGFGEFFPQTVVAQCLVICQSMIYFLFVAIFMGFFVSRI
jgi:hypothetical protein